MTEFEKVRDEIRDRLIETVRQRAEQLPKLDAGELMYAAFVNELTRIELRMRALESHTQPKTHDEQLIEDFVEAAKDLE